MQENPVYENMVSEIRQYLVARAEVCVQAGISRKNILIDPGFGFGKTLKNNLSLLKEMRVFSELAYPVLVGVSRKSMFSLLLDRAVEDRMVPSVAAVVIAYQKGARIFRVHDVAETCDALKVCAAVEQS